MASGDNDIEAWQQWLAPAMEAEPGLVTISGDKRFQSIDAKLGVALNSMTHDAGENVQETSMKLRQRVQARRTQFSLVMGKKFLAFIKLYHHEIRTTSHVEVMYTRKNLYASKNLDFRMMGTFTNPCIETLNRTT